MFSVKDSTSKRSWLVYKPCLTMHVNEEKKMTVKTTVDTFTIKFSKMFRFSIPLYIFI